MSYHDGRDWLPSYLVPFFYLSYPVDAPEHPDSFPDSRYYLNGPLDMCLVITCIAVMAVLRDIFRIFVFEPFARWVLNRDLEYRRSQQFAAVSNGKIANGKGNGHSSSDKPRFNYIKEQRKINRSVTRFAEQGWSAIYYPLQCALGFVSV